VPCCHLKLHTSAKPALSPGFGLRGRGLILLAILHHSAVSKIGQLYFNNTFIVVMVSARHPGLDRSTDRPPHGLIISAELAPSTNLSSTSRQTANHELLAYRVVADSPVLRGERIPRLGGVPRWFIRDGKSMRSNMAEGLRETTRFKPVSLRPGFFPVCLRPAVRLKVCCEEDDKRILRHLYDESIQKARGIDTLYVRFAQRSGKIDDISGIDGSVVVAKPDYADPYQMRTHRADCAQNDEHRDHKWFGIFAGTCLPADSAAMFLNRA